MAQKLTILEEAFKKFDMEDLGCQMLLSCESAQLETNKHPVYGDITPRMHKILR